MSVVGKTEEDSVILSGIDKPMTDEDKCMLGTGYFYNNKAVFFEDVLDEYGRVTLRNGIPGTISTTGKFTPLSKICQITRR